MRESEREQIYSPWIFFFDKLHVHDAVHLIDHLITILTLSGYGMYTASNEI